RKGCAPRLASTPVLALGVNDTLHCRAAAERVGAVLAPSRRGLSAAATGRPVLVESGAGVPAIGQQRPAGLGDRPGLVADLRSRRRARSGGELRSASNRGTSQLPRPRQ